MDKLNCSFRETCFLTGARDNFGQRLVGVICFFSTAQYQVRSGPFDLGISGWPTTGDIDGDGRADPAMVVNTLWYIWFSGAGYQLCGGPWNFGVAGTPVAADFDGR